MLILYLINIRIAIVNILQSYIKNNFGKKLAYIRKKRNLSQMQLAEIMDCNFNYISRIECGRANITMNMIEILADALDIDAKELFDF